MFKQVALSAILGITLTATVNGQINRSFTSEWIEGREATKAIARFGDLSPDVIRKCLIQMRQPAYLPGPMLEKKIIESQYMPIADGKRIDRLKAALQPVLDYHERSRMPVYVLRSEKPKAYLVETAVLIITTRMMMIASDEEIRGIVAHELAHEYVWEERSRAQEAKNGELMRECELFCDAVAAFTLKEIGDDPASYRRILERLTHIGITMGSATRHKSDTHPSLYARKKLNKFLSRQFD